MQRPVKIILALAIIGLGLTLVSNRLAARIESVLREDALAVLGLKVDVDEVNIRLARGTATIDGMKVANPSGFQSDHVFDLTEIYLDISVLSLIPGLLGWSPYRIEEILIDAPAVRVDIDEQGRSNLEQISRMVTKSRQAAAAMRASDETTSSSDPRPEEGPAASTPKAGDKPLLFRVDRLVINDLGYSLNRAGKPPESGTLPNIEMQDIGDQAGITPAGLGVMVSARLASEILAVVMMRKAGDRLNQRAQGLLNRLLGTPGADAVENGFQ